jgi:hypothetical protein
MGFTPKPDIFKSVLNALGGPAQPCHYVCVITPPPGMLAGGSLGATFGGAGAILGASLAIGASANLAFMAESLSIPGRQFRTTNHYIYGSYRRMPVGVEYQPLMITYICSNAMVERHFFDIWHQFIQSPTSQYMEYYNDYVGSITVKKLVNSGLVASLTSGTNPPTLNNPLVEVGNLAATYVIEEAYPVSIQAQELSYASDDYLRLTIEFSYRTWRAEPLSTIFDNGSEVKEGVIGGDFSTATPTTPTT